MTTSVQLAEELVTITVNLQNSPHDHLSTTSEGPVVITVNLLNSPHDHLLYGWLKDWLRSL